MLSAKIYVHQLLNFLTASQIWVALAAVALYRAFYKLTESGSFQLSYGFLLFGATLVVYVLHRSIWIQPGDSKFRRPDNLQIGLIFFGFMLVCVNGFYLNISEWTLLIVPGLIAFNYLIYGKLKASLKRHFVLKPLAIAFSWAWVCGVPFLGLGTAALLSWITIFFLVFTLAVLFDIKDLDKDKVTGFSTLANRYGIKKVKTIAFISLFLCTLTWVFLWLDRPFGFAAPVLFFGFSWIAVKKTNVNSNQFHYSLVLDGIMILFWLMIEVFDQITKFM